MLAVSQFKEMWKENQKKRFGVSQIIEEKKN